MEDTQKEIDKSKFNLKYFFVGDGAKDWFKALGNGWRLLVIILCVLLIGFTIWKAFFEKKNQQQIHIGSGSTVNIKQGDEKKPWPWWIPHPFVDIYGFQESDNRSGMGARFGGRWEL